MKVGDIYYDIEEKKYITIKQITHKFVLVSGYKGLGFYVSSNGYVRFPISYIKEKIKNEVLLLQK